MTNSVDTSQQTPVSGPNLVHIFGRTPHHYMPMVTFLNRLPLAERCHQCFWAWASKETSENEHIVHYPDGNALLAKIRQQPTDTAFVFHGMFDRSIWPTLSVSGVLPRAAWVCWGAEIYQHKAPSKTWKLRVAFWFHRWIVKRFGYVFALNDGDGQLIQNMLWQRDTITLPYPLIASEAQPSAEADGKTVAVLVGNSASENNHHLSILASLAHFADEDMILTVPLNYAGPKKYVDKVLTEGKRLFADKFVPITHMLAKNEYDQLLADTDVAVFGHKRQQGLYVVYSMLKHGKKMFIDSSTTSYRDLTKMGFDIAVTEEIAGMNFDQFARLTTMQRDSNPVLMQKTYSETALIPKWESALSKLLKQV